ncbi:MAG: PAS domain-containing protein [Alphaproteobacteria bacterium]|nr:PAS domain-containing protein [Alphaproteobacteria bacterium]
MAKLRRYAVPPTNKERPWAEDELIVSKTDTKGIITYANPVFLRLAQMSEQDAIGTNHNVIRHPDMPRCVFKFLWDTISTGKEVFAYVKNMATSGDYYWVFAHVTATYDDRGRITSYHSNRRKPKAEQIAKIEPVYKLLLAEEAKYDSPKDGLEASLALLIAFLKDKGMSYDEFIFTV